jgi:RecJ-like exonuclease
MNPRLRASLPSILLAVALPAVAHHSFPAQYDIDKPISLTGKVTKVEWTNPHIFIYADVTDATGAVVSWAFEMGGPNALLRQGWKRDSLKVGDIVIFDGSLARDGSNLVNARTVTMAETGRKMFAGSSGGDQAPARE